MSVVGSDSTENCRAACRIGIQVDLDVGHVAQVLADLVDHLAHPNAGPAPRRAEMHDGRSGAGQAEVCGVGVVWSVGGPKPG